MRNTRSTELKPLRDLIIVGNLLAQKVWEDPNNLANTWDEMVIRLRNSGLLEKLGLASVDNSVDAIVRRAFQFAVENPDVARWNSVASAAGAAAVRFAADNKLMLAAMMEGLAEEAKRQALALVPA